MAYTCAIPKCSNGSYRLNKWKMQLCTSCGCLHKDKECSCQPPFRLYPFPTTKKCPERRAQWKQLVGQKDGNIVWSPSKDSRVCSEHFKDGEPTKANPLPTQNLGYSGFEKRVKRMQFFAEEPKKATYKCVKPSDMLISSPICEDPPMETLSKSKFELPLCVMLLCIIRFLSCYCFKLCEEIKQLNEENKRLTKAVETMKNVKYVNSILTKDGDVTFYTGLPTKGLFEKFHILVAPLVNRRWLGVQSSLKKKRTFLKEPQRFGPSRKLTSRAEFLLTLMRLRLGLVGKDLALRFNISESLCARIFLSWLRACATVFGSMIFLPDEETAIAIKPKKFSGVKNVLCIIDCTEIFIETPKQLMLQSVTWSDYKHHNTLKVLVACSPNSLITYVSKAYTGRISDKALTLDCRFLDLIPPHSAIMADKGFTIGDECANRLIELHIPPGRRGQSQMTKSSVIATKKIANNRILIEQVIRRLKTFKLLQGELPVTLIPHVDDILKVCCGICNTKGPIYK